MPFTYHPGEKIHKTLTFERIFGALSPVFPEITPLVSKGDRPLQMNFEKELNALIRDAIHNPADTAVNIIRPFMFPGQHENQLLFFLKPEVFMLEVDQASRVVELAVSHLLVYGVHMDGAAVVPGPHLSRSGTMDRHYGYINQMSREASTLLTPSDREAVLSALEVTTEVPMLGGQSVLRGVLFPRQSLPPVGMVYVHTDTAYGTQPESCGQIDRGMSEKSQSVMRNWFDPSSPID